MKQRHFADVETLLRDGSGFEAYNFLGGFRLYDAVMNARTLTQTAYTCGMDK